MIFDRIVNGPNISGFVCNVMFCFYAKKASKSIVKELDYMFSKYVFFFCSKSGADTVLRKCQLERPIVIFSCNFE